MTATLIRAAERSDAAEIARLFTVLGHPTDAAVLDARWAGWIAEGNSALVAVLPDSTLAGVATLHRMTVLHRPMPVGRVTALVVDTPYRGEGIGRTLVVAAEDILHRAGCGLMEITSNLKRADAHAFYERLGYDRTSLRFAKVFAPVD